MFGFQSFGSTPSIGVDVATIAFDGVALQVLLVERQADPYRGWLALPSVPMKLDERVVGAAARAIAPLEASCHPIGVFDDPDRDPRQRVVGVAYLALVRDMSAARLPASGRWLKLASIVASRDELLTDRPPRVAFDHQRVIARAADELALRSRRSSIAFELLPERFTLTQLQTVHEVVRGVALDKRNFRRKLLLMGALVDTGELESNVAHRAARLFELDHARCGELAAAGLPFAP